MNLFHVHTYRCKHAGDEKDEAYILKAIEMGADEITFSDHAPFPGNPFGNRMGIEQLDEYSETLKSLRKKYDGKIKVGIGLETEYLPSFKSYYKELSESGKIDFLMIGQHMAEVDDSTYTFSWDSEKKNKEEHVVLVNAMIEGIESGFFKYVAHPDRAFRRLKTWTDEANELSKKLISAAVNAKIPLEKNLSSMELVRNYWEEFWKLVPSSHPTFCGVDAHSPADLERIWKVKKTKGLNQFSKSVVRILTKEEIEERRRIQHEMWEEIRRKTK